MTVRADVHDSGSVPDQGVPEEEGEEEVGEVVHRHGQLQALDGSLPVPPEQPSIVDERVDPGEGPQPVRQSPDLVEDVNHLSSCIRQAEHIILGKISMRREYSDVENHRYTVQKRFQILVVWRFEQTCQYSHGFSDIADGPSPAGLEPHFFKIMFEIIPYK